VALDNQDVAVFFLAWVDVETLEPIRLFRVTTERASAIPHITLLLGELIEPERYEVKVFLV
jgi:hypothetical protein